MLRVAQRTLPSHIRARLSHTRFNSHSTSAVSRRHDPLNILFCGADEFSIASLRALHKTHTNDNDKIASIEVVCRPDKRTGRGLKKIHPVPIKAAANALNLKLHQLDTFTSWTPPRSINLIIAVSFGLLVPPRILQTVKYGGLNVHPSLLPDLRGPAPIAHTLLKRRSHTGVTLQTMHPSRFDHGMILAQTPTPGLSVPSDCSLESLVATLSGMGAEILSAAVGDGLFVPPIRDIRGEMPDPQPMEHAPKILPEDRHVDWRTWSAERIVRYDRVLGKLWDMQSHLCCVGGQNESGAKRVTFEGPWRNFAFDDQQVSRKGAPGEPCLCVDEKTGQQILGILTCDRHILVPRSATIEGSAKGKGLQTLMNALTSKLREAI